MSSAVWCSAVQCGVVWCTLVPCGAELYYFKVQYYVCCNVLQCVAMCCSVLQCAALCCSVSQRGTAWCSVVPCDVVSCYFKVVLQAIGVTFDSRCVDADDSRVTS